MTEDELIAKLRSYFESLEEFEVWDEDGKINAGTYGTSFDLRALAKAILHREK